MTYHNDIAESKPVATVIVCRGNAILEPGVPAVRELLRYETCEFELGGPCGYRRVQRRYDLFDRDLHGRVAFGVGMLPRVVTVLEQLGYCVEIFHRGQDGAQLDADKDKLNSVYGEDRRLLQAVMANQRGQIEVCNFAGMIKDMVLIIRLYPTARVMVAMATRKMARKLRWHLERALDQPVVMATGAWSGNRDARFLRLHLLLRRLSWQSLGHLAAARCSPGLW